jgi:hypothetical protein
MSGTHAVRHANASCGGCYGAVASLFLDGDGVDVEDGDRDGRMLVRATASDGHCEILRGVEQKLTFDSESGSIVVV